MFNPFKKPYSEVTLEDLEFLKEVSEGWFVEYKRDKPSPRKIAKSIASFANSEGGLLFIGIKENRTTCTCENIVGVEDSLDSIRDSVRGHISPFPYFDLIPIKVTDNKNVIMAVVPESINVPHIHSDGRIYRRQGGASDPIPENDRYNFDRLIRKGEKAQKRLDKFWNNDLFFCDDEINLPSLSIYMHTIPFQQFIVDSFKKEDMIDIIRGFFQDKYKLFVTPKKSEEPISITQYLPVTIAGSCANGYILRQLANNGNLIYNGLICEIDQHANLKANVPLQIIQDIKTEANDQFIKCIESNYYNFDQIRFLKSSFIYGAVSIFMLPYLAYLDHVGFNGLIGIKFSLNACELTSPYIDSKEYLEYIQEYGLPVCMKNKQLFPQPHLVLEKKDLQENNLYRTALITTYILEALGIPYHKADMLGSMDMVMTAFKNTKAQLDNSTNNNQ